MRGAAVPAVDPDNLTDFELPQMRAAAYFAMKYPGMVEVNHAGLLATVVRLRRELDEATAALQHEGDDA